MIQVVEYEDLSGQSPYKDWFDGLNAPAAAKVAAAIIRISLGNFGKSKSVGNGVSEFKIDFGPGYRIYFGRDGNTLVILLGGGTKQHQPRDKTKLTNVGKNISTARNWEKNNGAHKRFQTNN